MKFKLKKEKNKGFGFTIFELAIVMTIIGLLVVTIIGGEKLIQFSHLAKARQVTQNACFIKRESLLIWLEPTLRTSFSSRLSDNDSVSQWNNLADSDYNATQSNSSYQPTFKEKGINNVPSVYFDGSNDSLSFSYDSVSHLNPSKFTIFIVYSPETLSDYGVLIDSESLRKDGFFNYIYPTTGGVRFEVFSGPSSSNVLTSNTLTVNNTYVLCAMYDGTNASLYHNNSLVNSTAVNYKRLTGEGIAIGYDTYGSGRNWFQGYISEIILFGEALNSTQRAEIHEYLNSKYRIYQ